MRIAKPAIAGSLLGILLAGISVAEEVRSPEPRQPTSVQQTAFEYENYARRAWQEKAGDLPSGPAAPAVEQLPALEQLPADYGDYTAGGQPSCCEPWCESRCCCSDPVFTAYANAVIMHRSTPNGAVLVTDSYVPGGNVLLDASEFNFDYEGGWEFGFARYLNPKWDVEFRYFSIDGWSAARAPVLSPNGSVTQYVTPTGLTNIPAEVSGVYRSELENIEILARRRMIPWLDVSLGFRYLELEDGGLAMVHNIGPGASLVTHAVDATNYLYGFQLGADFDVLSRRRFGVEGIIKAGIYGNDARNAVMITHAGPQKASAAHAGRTAFVGELGLGGLYRVTDSVALRAGYRLMWIEGVALASDQVAVSDPAAGAATVNFNGSPYYDGVYIGLELNR